MNKLLKAINAIYNTKKEDLKEIKHLSINKFLETKANEANHTANTGFWEEFVVPEMLASNIIERVREKKSLLTLMNNQMAMMSNPYSFPVEGADVEMTIFPEGKDVPATGWSTSKPWTQKLTLTAKKIGTVNYFTEELFEDSVINFMNFVEKKMATSYVTSLHNIIINWDTTTAATGNINSVDAAPAANSNYLIGDGLRKKAFDAWRTIDAWTMDVVDIRGARAKMGLKGTTPEDLKIIMNSELYMKILSLGQVETVEKFGVNATIVKWVLEAIDGMEVVVREEVKNANAAWKVSVTPANNTKGQMVLCHIPSMYLGFKRQFVIKEDFDVKTDQHIMSATTRPAYNQNDYDAWSSAVIYNITL